MSANSFGRLFKVSTFGESHGKALGALIEGCPSGVEFDEDLLRENLRRRRPGQSKITTSRDEADEPTLLSGVYLSKTLGTPIAIVVNNRDADSSAYTDELLKTRAGHATDLWQEKFGHSDPRGSGRASGRETLARVLGGSVAQMALRSLVPGLKTFAFVSQVGPIFLDRKRVCELADRIFNSEVLVDQYLSRFPDKNGSENVEVMLEQAKIEGESYGGVIELFIYNTPKGLGQPVFKKMKSEMASALMGIGAVNSVSVGFSEEDRSLKGSEFHSKEGVYGGLRGGITTGEVMHFRIGFKAPATLGKNAKEGRHDPCILPRAVPVIESMANIVIFDQILQSRLDKIK